MTVIRVREGEPLPDGTRFMSLLGTEDVPVGSGTSTERVFTLLVEQLRAEARSSDPEIEGREAPGG